MNIVLLLSNKINVVQVLLNKSKYSIITMQDIVI